MIHIKKGNEPRALTMYKQQIGAYYDNCPKEEIRQALLKEQGFLCAYCMRRIDDKNMKIEHWESQSSIDSQNINDNRSAEKKKMDYRNMLGVCSGKWPGTDEMTCDSHRGNVPLIVNPLRVEYIEQILYKEQTGEIYADDMLINKDLDQTLNLNIALLKENRKVALQACKSQLSKLRKNGKWNSTLLQKQFAHYSGVDENGKKQPYAGIIIWYLQKRLHSK